MNNNSRALAIVSYFTWIGLLISFILRDKNDTLVTRHLNQALVLNIASTLASLLIKWGGIFGIAGAIINVACLVLFFAGLYRAIKMDARPLPIIGDFSLIA